MSEKSPTPRSRRALQSLKFFMDDMQAGVGPFLGVLLLAHGWKSGWIGSVMSLGRREPLVVSAPDGRARARPGYRGAQ